MNVVSEKYLFKYTFENSHSLAYNRMLQHQYDSGMIIRAQIDEAHRAICGCKTYRMIYRAGTISVLGYTSIFDIKCEEHELLLFQLNFDSKLSEYVITSES